MSDPDPLLDDEIQNLLNELQQGTADYPLGLMNKRAAGFKQAALGLSALPQVGGFLKGSQVHLLHLPARAVEGILLTTLVISVAATAYIFREEISDLFIKEIPTIALQTAAPSQTLTFTPSATPSPTITPTATEILPIGTKNPHPTDQGWHYGQTKTP